MLIDITKGTEWGYAKSNINQAYLSNVAIRKIIKVMKNIDLSQMDN